MCEKNIPDLALIYNKNIKGYNVKVPFNPPELYPELLKFNFEVDPKNEIYDMVRNIFIFLQLDKKHIGTQNWNPLSEFVNEGDQVLIKPNFVKHFHPLGKIGVLSQVTHASILRPIIDYVLLAQNGKGSIIIADTPLDKADFPAITNINKTSDLCSFYKNFKNINILLYDLRSYKRKVSKKGEYLLEAEKLPGPPGGYIKIDLKNNSAFKELDNMPQNYYTLADFKVDRFNPRSRIKSNTNKYHSPNKHIYKIPRIILESNIIISVPKLKTHQLAGVSLNLKNMIGICEKIYLPHYRQGHPPFGDAFQNPPPSTDIIKRKFIMKLNNLLKEIIVKIKRIPIISNLLSIYYNFFLKKIEVKESWWGGWYGNDTLWRTIYDLNKILFYSDVEGNLKEKKQRSYFSIIDGIIAQEGEGPMMGNPKNCGIIVGSIDPMASDALVAHLMGFDIKNLNLIDKNRDIQKLKIGISDIKNLKISSNIDNLLDLNLKFSLPHGYKNIQRKQKLF